MNLEKQVLEFLKNSLNWYLTTTPYLFPENPNRIKTNELAIFEVENIKEATDAQRLQSMENILNSLPINETHFFYLIYGSKGILKFFYGIAPNLKCRIDDESVRKNVDFSAEVLYTSLAGNLEDSTITPINSEGISELLMEIEGLKFNAMIEGTPGIINSTNLTLGIDRLSTVMAEDDFVYLVIGHRFTIQEIACFIEQIEEIDNLLSLITDEIITKEFTDGNSSSCANNLTNIATNTDSYSKTRQTQKGIPEIGKKNEGEEIIEENNEIEEVFNSHIIKLDGIVKTKALQGGISNALTNTKTQTKLETTIVKEILGNMGARERRHYIQNVLYPRLNYALGNSLYLYSSILKTNSKAVLNKLESLIKSIYSGSSGNNVPIKFTDLAQNDFALEAFRNFQLLTYAKYQDGQCKKFSCEEISARKVFSQVTYCDFALGGNLVSSRELGIMASLPKDLTSIYPLEEYRLNSSYIGNNGLEEHTVLLGDYVRNRQIMRSQKIILSKKIITNNLYLTGSFQESISGILYRILEESGYSYLIVNTKRNNQEAVIHANAMIYDGLEHDRGIFPINLFQFYKRNQIQAQVDFIKHCFQSILSLSDMLLSIVERGCYECYIDYGWDIETSENPWFGEHAFLNKVNAFPIVGDLIDKVKMLLHDEILDDSIREKCSLELRTKLEVLLLGRKAKIFNARQSIDFFTLLKQKSYLNLASLHNSMEREFYITLLVQKLYQISEKLKERVEDFHFLTAWNCLQELFPNQVSSYQRMDFFEQYIEHASKAGLSYYLFDTAPNRWNKDILKQIPTIISGRITKLEDRNSIENRIKLSKAQREKLMELEAARVLFSFDDDSFVFECESFY